MVWMEACCRNWSCHMYIKASPTQNLSRFLQSSFISACGSFIVIFLLPESHYWLLKQNKLSEAIKTIKVVRGSLYDYSVEFEDIAFLQKELSDGWTILNEITSISFLKPVGIGVSLMVFQQCSGVNVIFFYAHEIFRRASMDDEAVASVIASSMQVFSVAFASLLVDKVGRRRLLLCSALGMAICHVLIGGCMFYISEVSRKAVMNGNDVNISTPNNVFLHNFTLRVGDNGSDVQIYTENNPIEETNGRDFVVSWACLVFVMLYIATYSLGMGPVPFIVLSEMVPFRGRGVACGIGTMCNWLCAFILTKSFIRLVEIFEVYGVFWLFSAVCLLAAIFIWRFVLETSGKTLAEIQDLLTNGSKKNTSFANEQGFFRKLLRVPAASPMLCSKTTRSSSVEEQTRELVGDWTNV